MQGSRYMLGLHPQFAPAVQWLDDWLRQFGYEMTLTSGYRSNEEQTALYAIGRTRAEIDNRVKKHGSGGAVTDAPAGQSPHNYGLAVDLDSDDPNTATFVQVAKIFGFGTVSWDPDHLEHPQWRTLAGLV